MIMGKSKLKKIVATQLLAAALLLLLFVLGQLGLTPPQQNDSGTKGVSVSQNEKQSGTVTKVVDGDTLKVDINGGEETVRLIGIDTPELARSGKAAECFAKQAQARLKSLAEGKSVNLEADSSQADQDRYGRLLRYVLTTEGENLNLTMIKDGYAFEYTYDKPYQYQSEFKAAQTDARTRSLGLWASCE